MSGDAAAATSQGDADVSVEDRCNQRPARGLTGAVVERLESFTETRAADPGVLGLTAGVLGPQLFWHTAEGYADVSETRSLVSCDLFRIYSATKVYTATLVLQLVEGEALSLEAPLANWYPEFPNSDTVTLRHLLSHTSGLADYLYDPDVWSKRRVAWDPDALLAEASEHPAKFEPGAQYDYSNTNYLLLGRIIEQVEGDSYRDQLHSRILVPLELRHTYLEGFGDVPPLVEGSRWVEGVGLRTHEFVHPSVSWAAGAMVATTEDVLLFARGLFGGALLNETTLALMTTPLVLNDGSTAPTGLGIGIATTSSGPYYGHSGGGANTDFQSWLGYVPGEKLAVAVLSNTGKAPALEVANELLRITLSSR